MIRFVIVAMLKIVAIYFMSVVLRYDVGGGYIGNILYMWPFALILMIPLRSKKHRKVESVEC